MHSKERRAGALPPARRLLRLGLRFFSGCGKIKNQAYNGNISFDKGVSYENCCFGRGTEPGAQCFPLLRHHDRRGLRGRGHRAALVDLYFGLEDYNGPTEAYFDAPLSDAGRRVQREAPDLEQVKAARKWKGKSQFGPGVLELCALADVVFLALHGQCGEDGRVQAAFDLMGIPYTGAGYLGSALAMDKDLTKRLISGLGVDTPKWRTVRYTEADVDRLTSTTPAPCVVKPVDSGSSIGVSIAHDKKELHAALLEGLRFGGHCVLEQYVRGREVQVGVLEDRGLPSIEIIPKQGFYDYANKYQPGAAVEVCPAPIRRRSRKSCARPL